MEEIGEIPDDLRVRITEEEDAATLKRWLKKAARAEKVEDFLKEIPE